MKLHSTAIDKIIRLCENYSGYRDQKRLKRELLSLQLEVYQRSTGEKILVTDEDLSSQLRGPIK